MGGLRQRGLLGFVKEWRPRNRQGWSSGEKKPGKDSATVRPPTTHTQGECEQLEQVGGGKSSSRDRTRNRADINK